MIEGYFDSKWCFPDQIFGDFFNEFDEWLETVTSIVSDRLSREGVHASTFFTIRECDGKTMGTARRALLLLG